MKQSKTPAPKIYYTRDYSVGDSFRKTFIEQNGMAGLRTGVCDDGNLVVLDVDKDRGGFETLAALRLPSGPKVHTPSGGFHLYFRVPKDIIVCNDSNGRCFGQGLDVKGENGYVVAPGSHYQGARYELEGEWPIRFDQFPELPEEYLPNISRKERPAAEQHKFFDDEGTVESAKFLLESWHDEKKGSRTDSLFIKACQLKDLGIPPLLAEQLLLDSAPEGIRGIGQRKFIETIAGAYQRGSSPAGISNILYNMNDAGQGYQEVIETFMRSMRTRLNDPEFSDTIAKKLEEDTADALQKLAARWVLGRASDIKHARDVKWLIQGVVPENGLSILYGPPGSGKSFIAIDFALHVATGTPWVGRAVKKNSVLYLAAEARLAIENRLIAAQMKPHLQCAADNFQYYPFPISLKPKSEDFETLRAILKLNPEIKFVIIDTLSRAFDGSENDNDQVKAFLNAVQSQLINECNVSVLFVHHNGKDVSKGAKGSGHITAYPETIMTIAPVMKASNEIRVTDMALVCEKSSDEERFAEQIINLKQVVVGHGENGPITSCYVEYAADHPALVQIAKAAKDFALAPFYTEQGQEPLL